MKILLTILLLLPLTSSAYTLSNREILIGQMQGFRKFEMNQPKPDQTKIDKLNYLIDQANNTLGTAYTQKFENDLKAQLPDNSAYNTYLADMAATNTVGSANFHKNPPPFLLLGIFGSLIVGLLAWLGLKSFYKK